LAEVTPQHIQDFHQSIFDEGHTPNTVIHYHAVLRRALQNAVKKEIIGSNPADRVDRPRRMYTMLSFIPQGNDGAV
jgi:site-specific recombinase XerD